jgi:hypothetical protein
VTALHGLPIVLMGCWVLHPEAPPPQLPDTLTDRVAREVSCAREHIVVMPLGGDLYEAIACDKRATFSCVKHFHRVKGVAHYSDSCMQQQPWTAR